MVNYRNTQDEQKKIRDAFKELMEKNNRSKAEIVRALNKWADKKVISEAMLGYCLDGKEFSGEKGNLIYTFLSQSEEFSTSIIRPESIDVTTQFGKVVSQVGRFFKSEGISYSYNALPSLVGTYTMYRPCWLSNSENYYIQSLVRISIMNGVYVFEESQEFELNDTPVIQDDLGFIFPYSSNFFSLTNSDQCMKFYAIDQLFPEPDGIIPTENFSGNMIGLSGKGPHPSFKFYCKRLRRGSVRRNVFKISDLEKNSPILEIIEKIY